MKESLRCPHCGAANPPNARWCGQCLESFAAPEPPAPPVDPQAEQDPTPAIVGRQPEAFDPLLDPLERAPVSVPIEPAPETPVETAAAFPASAVPPEAIGMTRGAFSVTQSGITWACAICETVNSLEHQICAACGAAIAKTLRPEPPPRPQRDPGTVAIMSLVFPGAGHAALGLWGQAIARGVLSAWAMLVAFLGFVSSEGGTGALIPIVFSVVALVLWLVAAHDSFREASGAPGLVILKTRYFIWVVLSLLGLIFALLMIASLGVSGVESDVSPEAQGSATASIGPAGP